MSRHVHVIHAIWIAWALNFATSASAGEAAPGDGSLPSSARTVTRPDVAVQNALLGNPITAPYPIRASMDKGVVVLSGAVGTSQIHDIAVRTAIDLGVAFRDEIVIDTAEAHRVALMQSTAVPYATPPWGSLAGSAPYFVYPPPLFGRLDDPFFGFEPPLVSFPPWTAAARGAQGSDGRASIERRPQPQPLASARNPLAPPQPIKGNMRLTVDAEGQVFLEGIVASEEDRRTIEEEARRTPGVSRVYSDLRVAPRASQTPPPPPQPILREPRQPVPARPAEPGPRERTPPAPEQPTTATPVDPNNAVKPEGPKLGDANNLTRRVADALTKRPGLKGLPVELRSRGEEVTLAGKVPSTYEAMLAYRAVEQTPGVGTVVDHLEFQLPDEDHPNPLKRKGRPEDIEPYLVYQVRRHVGDLAHIDQVRLHGDVLEIRGTLLNREDQERVKATLRSMPLLRDFRVEPTLTGE